MTSAAPAGVVELWTRGRAVARRNADFVRVAIDDLAAVTDLRADRRGDTTIFRAGVAVAELSARPAPHRDTGTIPFVAAGHEGLCLAWISRDADGSFVLATSSTLRPVARVLAVGLDEATATTRLHRLTGLAA